VKSLQVANRDKSLHVGLHSCGDYKLAGSLFTTAAGLFEICTVAVDRVVKGLRGHENADLAFGRVSHNGEVFLLG